ncbi:MAG TPA: hypothetical protein VEX38_05395 [Fimbriimonadaceae bacterium]|nr:hypothetical protein [Fimbriimonadaceae bacterium]
MRQLLTLIILAAGAYFGYQYYLEHYAPSASPGAQEETGEVAPGGTSAPAPGVAAPATPKPFVSRISIPQVAAGEKPLAPPGVYYMLDRASVETKAGIRAVVPGDQVKLLQRKAGKVKVTDGVADYEVKDTQVTNDLILAQQAERAEFMKRGGR